MSPRQRPATVRFYFDADVLGLAKVIVSLRHDVIYPGIRAVSSIGGRDRHAPSPALPPPMRSGFRRLLAKGG